MSTAVDNYRNKLLERGKTHLKRLASRFEECLQSADFVRAELLLGKYEESEVLLEILDLYDYESTSDRWLDMHHRFMAAKFGPSAGEVEPK